MNSHTQNVLANIDARIATLTDLRTRLIDFDTLTPPAPVVATAVQTLERPNRRRKQKRATPPQPRKKRGPYQKRTAVAPVVESEEPVTPANPARTDTGAKITTLGGAMKAEINRLGRFSRDLLRKVIESNYAGEEFLGSQSFDVNLGYWCNKGKLEKVGTGPQAEFKVLDKDFFAKVEA